jgi:hypothetical protein
MFSWTQSIKVWKFINTSPWKEKWMSEYIWYTPLSQIFTIVIKSHTNMFHSCANLIKECTTSNNGITTFNPSNNSTLVNKHKLDLVKVFVGASNAIFMRRVWYSNNTCLTRLNMEIHLVLMFRNILLPFCFHDFCPFGKFQVSFGVMVEISIYTLQKIFNVRNQR